MRWALMLVVSAACGRHGFAPIGDAKIDDAEVTSDLPTDGPSLFGTFGGSGPDKAREVAIASDGTIVIAGGIGAAFTIGGQTVAGAGDLDAFVASFTAGGELRWARSFGSPAKDEAFSVALDEDGNVYIVGHFFGPVDFGGGALQNVNDDAFVASFTPEGGHRWSKRFGGNAAPVPFDVDQAEGVAVREGLLIVTGAVGGDVDFGAGITTGSAATTAFVLALDAANGAYRWVRRFGSINYNTGYRAVIGPGGNVVTAGFFEGTVDFGGGPVGVNGVQDTYVLALDSNGGYRWSTTFGSPGFDWPHAVHVDAAGAVYVAGFFEGPITVGGQLVPHAGNRDGVVASWTAAGTLRWVRNLGSATCEALNGITDAAGVVIVGGRFTGTLDVGLGALVSAGGSDSLVVGYDSATGVPLWQRSSGGVIDDGVMGLATAPTGDVLLVGFEGGNDDGLCGANAPGDLFIRPL